MLIKPDLALIPDINTNGLPIWRPDDSLEEKIIIDYLKKKFYKTNKEFRVTATREEFKEFITYLKENYRTCFHYIPDWVLIDGNNAKNVGDNIKKKEPKPKFKKTLGNLLYKDAVKNGLKNDIGKGINSIVTEAIISFLGVKTKHNNRTFNENAEEKHGFSYTMISKDIEEFFPMKKKGGNTNLKIKKERDECLKKLQTILAKDKYSKFKEAFNKL